MGDDNLWADVVVERVGGGRAALYNLVGAKLLNTLRHAIYSLVSMSTDSPTNISEFSELLDRPK